MKTKPLFVTLFICTIGIFHACSSQSNKDIDFDYGNRQIPMNTPNEMEDPVFDLKNLEGSIIEDFQDSADQWFVEKDKSEPSDLPSHLNIDLNKYIDAIENGTIRALSEMDDPEAYLKELIPYEIDEPESDIVETTYCFMDEDGERYEVCEDFLIIPK